MEWWELLLISLGSLIGAVIIYFGIAVAIDATDIFFPEYDLTFIWPITLPLVILLICVNRANTKFSKIRVKKNEQDERDREGICTF